MPHSKLHEEKKVKNYTMLALLFAWIVILFAVSIIRMSG